MPTSNTPTTVNCLMRGRMPAGVTWPWGAISTTLSPTRAPTACASSTPSTMPNSPGLQIGQAAASHVAADVGDLVFELGQDTAHQRAVHVLLIGQQSLR